MYNKVLINISFVIFLKYTNIDVYYTNMFIHSMYIYYKIVYLYSPFKLFLNLF